MLKLLSIIGSILLTNPSIINLTTNINSEGKVKEGKNSDKNI
ncbi:hypothetical protein [Spiroplasma endosymbiont of Dioctria linearis]